MPTITLIEIQDGLRLKITFSNGESLVISFARYFTPNWLPQFRDPSVFSQVEITDDGDGITWFGFVGFSVKELTGGMPDFDFILPTEAPVIPWYKKLIWR